MPEKQQHGGQRPGAGRKPGKDYPHRINVRVTQEQFSHLEQRAAVEDATIADYVRRLVDLDMLLPENKMIVTIPAATQAALKVERKPAADEGVDVPY